eukprot:CAMPEP_0181174134 /NCGR_PEP_ID=MMETSP1096-20121128/3373_1 /TAXON_ID=156174 ORGANISM="Chrysochromulina ericina, Strain CCMP281" /NCGR_SAMPLE_ID=MMETSP1096 /ASSEMBLY_ACC=CAM_ASM_000453 /LENGTH=32 /DNA_ID= /DNA_START= /DNA_END= /DNA_ORIENTATION=
MGSCDVEVAKMVQARTHVVEQHAHGAGVAAQL